MTNIVIFKNYFRNKKIFYKVSQIKRRFRINNGMKDNFE